MVILYFGDIMKKSILLTIIIAIVLSVIVASYIDRNKRKNNSIVIESKNNQLTRENTNTNGKNIIKETSSIESKTTPNTRLVEKKYYIDQISKSNI